MKRMQSMIRIFRTRRLNVPPAMLALLCTPMVLAPASPLEQPAMAAPMVQDAPPAAKAPTMKEALQLVRDQRNKEAGAAFAKIVEADPSNGQAWYMLGYCQLVQGHNAESIPSFEKAIEHDFNTGASLYNIACAHAKMNQVDEAMGSLRKALKAGFSNFDLLQSDPDLDNLREIDAFKHLANKHLIKYEKPAGAKDVTFSAADGVTIYGNLYETEAGKDAPFILLFHQGGSNKSEYYPIAPRLNKLGFSCLAIDARSGSPRFGHPNETAAGLGEEATMLGAYVDLEASLKYVREQGYTGPVTAWGSSYSAGLVFKLAADYPDDIIAVLSFSPPPPRVEVMGGDAYAPDDWANAAKAALFVTWPPNELNDQRQAFFDSIDSDKKWLYAQQSGVHGSSTLHEVRNPDGWEANWKEVTLFLEKNCR